MPKSLVTGGAGFIGSNIVDQLLDIGHQVIVIDNEHSDVHEHFYWNDNAENYCMDIRDTESIRPLFDGVNYVFHTAAEARIQPSIENPVESVSINSVGTCNVLQCAREAGVDRVVYAGLPEYEEKIEREDHGIPYHPEVLDWFKDICAELGIDWKLS